MDIKMGPKAWLLSQTMWKVQEHEKEENRGNNPVNLNQLNLFLTDHDSLGLDLDISCPFVGTKKNCRLET
jgi:hypothetical protein